MAVRDDTAPQLYNLGSKASPSGAVIQKYNGSTLGGVAYTLQEPSGFAMVEWNGLLWVFGADTGSARGGVYRTNASTYSRVLDQQDTYVCSAVVFEDRVYCGMSQGDVWRWDGSTFEIVGVGVGPSTDEIRGLAVWRGALWVLVRNGTELRLRRYDGEHWSEPGQSAASVLSGSANDAQALAGLGGKLYGCGIKASTAPVLVAAQGTYPTSAKTLETVLFDGGLPADSKVFRSVTINHAALAASQSIQVQYRLEDTGSWTSLGTNSTLSSTTATFSFSAGTVGKLIALRLLLTGTSSTTPTLYSVQLKYAPQPATKRRWTFEARYEGSAELPMITKDGTPSPDTGPTIESQVWTQKAASGPITFVDLDGASYSVWFVGHEVGISELSRRRGEQQRGKITLVEA
jgi:hypothetical protein